MWLVPQKFFCKQVINLFIHNPGQQLAKKSGTIKMLVEDIGNLRYKPLTSKKVKPLSYKEKQNADILLYGEMKTVKYNEWEYFDNDADCLKYESED